MDTSRNFRCTLNSSKRCYRCHLSPVSSVCLFVFCKFNCFGYLREASRYLVEVLEAVNASEVDDVIERVLDAVEKQPRESIYTSTHNNKKYTYKEINNN